MLGAEKLLVVLVLHSIGWHLHDCIITFISPAGKENGKSYANNAAAVGDLSTPGRLGCCGELVTDNQHL